MKIVHVINHLELGGAERLLGQLLPAMASIEPDWCFGCAVLNQVDEANMFRLREPIIVNVGGKAVYSLGAFTWLYKVISKLRPDIIHAHLFPSQLYVACVARLLNVPYVITEHSTTNGRRGKRLLLPVEKWVYSGSAGVISISKATEDNLVGSLGGRTRRMFIVENGIPLDEIAEAKEITRPLVFPENKKVLLSVGRLTEQKGFDNLIRMVPFLSPNIHLVIVGEGSERKRLEGIIEVLGLRNAVTLAGARSDVWALMQSADYYVQPSISEGFGIAAVEAMATGLPVFHSGCPGLAEVIGGAGIVVDISSPTRFAGIVLRAIRDEVLIENCIRAGKQMALRYSISRTAETYVKIYKELAAHS